MSRADAYDAYFRESRSRLLHQVYAFAGSTEVAEQALADAFTAAGQHWRKLSRAPDDDSAYKDAWVRKRAFSAAEKGPRSRQPWYVTARETADDHRAVLAALGSLEPPVRKVVILRYLAGLDLSTAAREVGLSDEAAADALHTASAALGRRGLDTSPAALTATLEGLRHDLINRPVGRPSQLRREGNRRSGFHLATVGAAALALAAGAWAVTEAQVDEPAAVERPTPEPRTRPPEPEPEPEPDFTEAQLAPVAVATMLNDSEPWRLVDSSADFAITEPIDECVSSLPSSPDAQHLWVRHFAADGGAAPADATQVLEIAPSHASARLASGRLVKQFAGCAAAGHQLLSFRSIKGVGDQAFLVSLRSIDDQEFPAERVAVARSGTAVVTWIARGTTTQPVPAPKLVRVLNRSVGSVCKLAEGACAGEQVKVVDASPPPADSTRGFLTTVDLPLFPGVTRPWVATAPRQPAVNPAATRCDRADFFAAGAQDVFSRSFVIPNARLLPPYFGMAQTNGQFDSGEAAARFMQDVISDVQVCSDRLRTLSVDIDEKVAFGDVTGRVWRIAVTTSADETLVFRVALLRYRDTVTQLTYTPAPRADTQHSGFAARVVPRAAQRLTQGKTPAPQS